MLFVTGFVVSVVFVRTAHIVDAPVHDQTTDAPPRIA